MANPPVLITIDGRLDGLVLYARPWSDDVLDKLRTGSRCSRTTFKGVDESLRDSRTDDAATTEMLLCTSRCPAFPRFGTG